MHEPLSRNASGGAALDFAGMARPRLALLGWIAAALALIGALSIVWIFASGRARLEHARASLRASGGPELPPQGPEISESGKRTEAWFAQFGDDDAWERDGLETAAAIDALPEGRSGEWQVLADALRVTDEQVAEESRELQRDKEMDSPLAGLIGTGAAEARSYLEFERADELRRRVRDLLEQQAPFERWDEVARAWIRSRTLAHPRMFARLDELLALGPFDPPAGRGIERCDLRYQRRAMDMQRALLDALPELARNGDRVEFARSALASLALGRLRARCWGLVPWGMDAYARKRAAWAIRECLHLLPHDTDLGAIEAAVAADRYRAEELEALRRERAVGNEILVDLRAGTVESARILDGKDLFERELFRLWIDHEQAGYLEIMTRAIGLAERAPFELPGGLRDVDELTADLRPPRAWRVIRTMITPDFRAQTIAHAQLEAEQQLTLLCFAAWREPTTLEARLAATQDPFTGKPLKMREQDGVLVFWSAGEDLRDDEPGAEHGDDIVARVRRY